MRRLQAVLLAGAVAVVTPALAAAQQPGNDDYAEELREAREEVREAQAFVREMLIEADLRGALAGAEGVLLVPDYGRGAVGVGGAGGSGVLYVRQNGEWNGPAFYNIGSISLGLQAGATAGQIAMLLMTDRAVSSFKGNTTFSLDAEAGLTILDYSARGKASLGTQDVVLYSDTEGAFAGVSLGASAITPDEEANRAFYGKAAVSPSEIMNGQLRATHPEAGQLSEMLPRR